MVGNDSSGFGGQQTVQTTGSGEVIRSRERSSASQLLDHDCEAREGGIWDYFMLKHSFQGGTF